MNKKSVATVGAVTGALLIGSASAALAIGQGRTYTYTLQDTGFKFPGTSTFFASGTNNGGMGYKGTLTDTSSSDGNSVFVNAKTMGYSYSARTYTSSSTYVDKYVYDPSATYVTYGNVQACRDRGSFGNDNCRVTQTLYR